MILLDPTRCKGCKLCEAACSLHHTGHEAFNPALISTHVHRDNDSGKITMSLDSTCDWCKGEETMLCVRYCAYGARSVKQ